MDERIVEALTKVLDDRHSTRAFVRGAEILSEDVTKIIQAAGRAPYASGGPRSLIHIAMDDVDGKYKTACAEQPYVQDASMRMIFLGKDDGAILRSGRPKYIYDAIASCMCADIMATALGYGTCWIGNFEASKVQALTPESLSPVIILLVGVIKTDG